MSTHLSMGTPCHWNEGDLVEAVLASCSVPGLLPPVYALDFSHSERLVQAGYEYALPRLREWTRAGTSNREDPASAGRS